MSREARSGGRLAMVMIARNEREHVRPCLESFGDHVDEIVVCDTGSRDGTVAEVRRVCREHDWMGKLVLGRFRWCHDFAAARNYAESLSTCEFVCNMDLDESVMGAENLRRCCECIVADAGSMTGANMLYAETCYYGRWVWWQRIARRGAFPYVFKVADPRPVRGGIGTVARDICHWIHRRQWHERSPDRHVRTAQRWVDADPADPTARFELAYELVDAQRPDEAVAMLRRYLLEYPAGRPELEALLARWLPAVDVELLRPLRVSMCLVARNEEQNVERCFSSWWAAVDEVVLLDTGSRDRTVEAAQEFARARGDEGKLIVGRFRWRDDYAAARNHADGLATGDLLTYCDLDETIHGVEHLREIAAANPDVVAFGGRREEAHWPDYERLGQSAGCAVTGKIWQCVMIRRGVARWRGALHASWDVAELGAIPPRLYRCIHHKPAHDLARTYRAYLRISEKAARRHPDDARAMGELALTLLQAVALGFSNDHERAVEITQRYFAMPDWRDARLDPIFLAARQSVELRALGRREEAQQFGAQALREAHSLLPNGSVDLCDVKVPASLRPTRRVA